jgi:hypothetical protein
MLAVRDLPHVASPVLAEGPPLVLPPDHRVRRGAVAGIHIIGLKPHAGIPWREHTTHGRL